MTNLIAELTITLTLATNWTGVNVGTNELGYVVTNHTARVFYDGATIGFPLKSVPSNIAVWRPRPSNLITFTNLSTWSVWPKGIIWHTNAVDLNPK